MPYGKYRKRARRRRGKKRKWRQQKLAVGTVQRIAKVVANTQIRKNIVKKWFNPLTALFENSDPGYVAHGRPFYADAAADGSEGKPHPFFPDNQGNLYALDNIPQITQTETQVQIVDSGGATHAVNQTERLPENTENDVCWRNSSSVLSTRTTVKGWIRSGGTYEGTVHQGSFEWEKIDCAATVVEVALVMFKKRPDDSSDPSIADIHHMYMPKFRGADSDEYRFVAYKKFIMGTNQHKDFSLSYTKARTLRWDNKATAGRPDSPTLHFMIRSFAPGGTSTEFIPKAEAYFNCLNFFHDTGEQFV